MSSRRRSLRHPHQEDEEAESPRRPRRAASGHIVLELFIGDNEDNDEEYQEDDKADEDEDKSSIADESDFEEEEEKPSKKRSRSRSSPLVNDKRQKVSDDDDDDDDDEVELELDDDEEEGEERAVKTSDLELVDDQYVLPEDPQGEQKINSDGELLGGRKYRIKAFTVDGKGSRLYMLSTELARLMGFRDSYLFFQKHTNLYKYITTDKQKLDLVDRGIMPLSYKLRTIGLVTAKSLFREFGALMVVDGKQVTDDYYEAKARENGAVEGELVKQPQEYHPGGVTVGNNELSGLSSVSKLEQPKELSSLDIKKYLRSTPENWIYNIATSTIHLNHLFYTTRPKFIKDPYTNVKFIPSQTQPTKTKWSKLSNASNGELELATVIEGDLKQKKMGLEDLDDSVFMDCVDADVREAIIKQREIDRTL